MKIYADTSNKILKLLESTGSIFKGEIGAEKLEVYLNQTLVNEYPTITALLSNGRTIGPFTTDDEYITEVVDGVTCTKAVFTLSKANGFTLTQGKMQITLWLNNSSASTKKALGNVVVEVVNTTEFSGGDIIVSGDVEGTIVNYKVELENLQSAVNTINVKAQNLEDITTKHTTRLEDLEKYQLGITEESWTNEDNDFFNEVIESGVYYFTYKTESSGVLGDKVTTEDYIMLVESSVRIDGNNNKISNVVQRVLLGVSSYVQRTITTTEYADGTINKVVVVSDVIEDASLDYVDSELAKKADTSYVDSAVENLNNNKLDKSSTPATLYAVGTSGLQEHISYSYEPYAYSIPNRDANGQLKVQEVPLENGHAASKKYVDTAIANLVNSAPETLDTLGEIAAALEENEDVVEALNNSISNKADKSYVDEVIASLNLYDYTYTTNPYVEGNVLYLENVSVEENTLKIKNGSVENNTLYL